MWPSGLTLALTLTLNFQGQIWNFLYLSQKWSDCHKTKSKHIDWTPGLKCDQYGFELDHKFDLWILKVKLYLDLWPHTWPWPWIFMVKFWNSCISEWEGRLTLHKGGGSRSFMTMIMTIWWPRSGVWIYQIVTGVTSVVGVPSTHLVWTTTLSPNLQVKSLQLIWRLDTCRWNLWVPDLQMSCSDLTRMIGYQDSSPSNGHQGTCPVHMQNIDQTLNRWRNPIAYRWAMDCLMSTPQWK